jgi:hypothetical protein
MTVTNVKASLRNEAHTPTFSPLNDAGYHFSHSTLRTLKVLAPPGASTSTVSPVFLPINARATGEFTEILPLLASAPAHRRSARLSSRRYPHPYCFPD